MEVVGGLSLFNGGKWEKSEGYTRFGSFFWMLESKHFLLTSRDISGPEYRWVLKMGQRPISHSFTYKNQDFDGPFCIFMGLLEKMMGPRILNRHLTAKLTSNLNSLCMRPNQKLKQIKSVSTSFLTKKLGPIPEISLNK